MINAYKEGRDLYATVASIVHGNGYWDNMEHFEDGSPNPEGKKRRQDIKSVVLGLLYGRGAASVAEQIGSTTQEAQELLDKFFNGFPTIKSWIEGNKQFAREHGYVEDLWGRRRRLPDIQLPKYVVTVEGEDKTSESLNFNPLLGSLGKVEKQKNPLIAEYEKLLQGCRSKKDSDAVITRAKKDHIHIQNNSGFISQAERQCTNSRIQGCLGPNTYIVTKEYGIIPISQVANQHLHVWDGQDWTKAEVLPSGLKQQCVISLQNHQQLICSPNHRFLTACLSQGKQVKKWKKCSELKHGDHILVNDALPKGAAPCDQVFDDLARGQLYRIPSSIMSNIDALREFISRYFDGDGPVRSNGVSLTWNKQSNFWPLLQDIQKALLILGVRSCIRELKSCYRLTIDKADVQKFRQVIELNSADEQSQVQCPTCSFDEHCSNRSVMVTDVTQTSEFIEMFDVCNTERGYFIADGLVTHNSAATMSKRALIRLWNDPEMKRMQFVPLILVHDEIIGECPTEYAGAVAERMSDIMKHAAEPECQVPFKVDASVVEDGWYAEEYYDDLQKEFNDLCKNTPVEQAIKEILSSHTEILKEDFDRHIKLPS